MKSITIIGNGNMAFSIAMALQNKYKLEIVGRDMAKLEIFASKLENKAILTDINSFDITDKIIILCVKPTNIHDIASKATAKAEVIYSVLAGTNIQKIKDAFSPKAVVRCMPNLAASFQKSMTTLTGDVAYRQEAEELFGSIGQTLWLASEKELDIATAVAGSGPAYLALVAEAMADGAVKQGMKREDAQKITQGLFDGFATLLNSTNPALLKDAVMSPGGTTAAGYGALEHGAVRYHFIAAIEAAYKRALEL